MQGLIKKLDEGKTVEFYIESSWVTSGDRLRVELFVNSSGEHEYNLYAIGEDEPMDGGCYTEMGHKDMITQIMAEYSTELVEPPAPTVTVDKWAEAFEVAVGCVLENSVTKSEFESGCVIEPSEAFAGWERDAIFEHINGIAVSVFSMYGECECNG